MDVMEHLAADLSCALEDTKIKKHRHWKNRRTRSTSNLIGSGAVLKTDSDESKDGNESDDAERCFAKLSIQNKSGSKFLNQQKIPLQSVVESDSFNELFGGCSSSQPKASQTKRKKRHKRMAVDASDLNDKHPGISIAATVIPKSNSLNHVGKKTKKKTSQSTDPQRVVEVDIGKRKRGHRQPNDLKDIDITGAIDTTDVLLETMNNIELNSEEMDADMKSDDDSSSVSASDSESTEETSSEGQEGDDEHSDYIVDEWVDDSVDSVERRRDLIMRRLRDYAPYREIRAGRRRIHPNKPVFSIRTSANEQLSKFLQDPEQSELRLHPMRKAERIQLSQIASLYSLQMHYHREDDGSEKGFTCPILTKTCNTAQMDTKSNDEGGEKVSWLGPYLNIENESDSKRIKK